MEGWTRARIAGHAFWFLAALLAAAGADAGAAEPRPSIDVLPDWRFVTGGRIRFAPAVSAEGVIYCLSDDRLLRAVGAGGREIWRYPLEARPAAAPVVGTDGSIYIVTLDRLLQAVGPQGRHRWARSMTGQPVFAPACGRDGSLYLPLESGYLAALDYRGRDRWTFRFKAEITSPPSVGLDGTVYVSTADRLFHALGRGGAERWTVALPGNGGAAALGSSGTVYVSAFGVHAFSGDGRRLWEFPIPYATTDPIVVPDASGRSDEIVIVGARNGTLHLIDARGARVEEIELGGDISLPPAMRPDGAILVSTSSGLCRVHPGAPQEPVALLRPKAPASVPLVTSAGLAIVGSEDWVLYASGFGDDGPAPAWPAGDPAAFWPQPRHDAGQTGRARAGGREESIAYLIQRELAASPLLSQKEGVIADLRAHFAGEAFLPLSASQLEELLVLLAQEGAVGVVYVGEKALTDYPELRAAACELLGSLGTGGAREALISVVEKDPRSEVQSKAAEALGNVAYDPDGRSSRALMLLAGRRASDERVLLVVVGALREVAAAGGPELGLGNAAEGSAEELALAARPAWEALVSLATESYPERVRVAARRALADLVAEVRR